MNTNKSNDIMNSANDIIEILAGKLKEEIEKLNFPELLIKQWNPSFRNDKVVISIDIGTAMIDIKFNKSEVMIWRYGIVGSLEPKTSSFVYVDPDFYNNLWAEFKKLIGEIERAKYQGLI